MAAKTVLVTGANRGIGIALAPVRLEVTKEDDIQAAVERMVSEAGRLDLLINNAATFAHDEDGVLHTRAD